MCCVLAHSAKWEGRANRKVSWIDDGAMTASKSQRNKKKLIDSDGERRHHMRFAWHPNKRVFARSWTSTKKKKKKTHERTRKWYKNSHCICLFGIFFFSSYARWTAKKLWFPSKKDIHAGRSLSISYYAFRSNDTFDDFPMGPKNWFYAWNSCGILVIFSYSDFLLSSLNWSKSGVTQYHRNIHNTRWLSLAIYTIAFSEISKRQNHFLVFAFSFSLVLFHFHRFPFRLTICFNDALPFDYQ